MKTLGETLQRLKEKWGDFDSNILLTDEVKEMDPVKREKFLNEIADLYLQADSESSMSIIRAQREAYTEGNCEFYEEF